MDKIKINSTFSCNIGVTSKERAKKQKIEINAELFFDTRKAADSDDIKDTVNYSDVYSLMKNISENKEYRLIETLANDIAESILDKFDVEKVNVAANKKLPDFNASAEISREKNG